MDAIGVRHVSMTGEDVTDRLISVVLPTFNRVAELDVAIRSVLRQTGVDLELIVVDDGSTDGTADLLSSLSDQRLHLVRRAGGLGVCAARNAGIARARGEWITFIDDDDVALDGWLAGFTSLIGPGVGVVSCGVEYWMNGHLSSVARPAPTFNGQVGLPLAGGYAVRADILRGIGGFDEQMQCSENSELWMRLTDHVDHEGLSMDHVDVPLVRITQRPARDRPAIAPARLVHSCKRILEKHPQRLARDPRTSVRLHRVLGVNAARLGRWPLARASLWAAATTDRRELRDWARLALALCPPVGKRVWALDRGPRDDAVV